MAESEPPWVQQSFPIEVIRYSLRKFGFFEPVDFIEGDKEFVEIVETVGKAVFTLQVIIRNRLRPLLISSINLAAGVADWYGYRDITAFVRQGYLKSDGVNSILSFLAVKAELIMFLGEFGYPIPNDLFYHVWSNVYSYRLKDRLASMGGFGKLLELAKRRYINSDLYRETSFYFENNTNIPYAEVNTRGNWPDDILEFLHQRIGVAPAAEMANISMIILRQLYKSQRIVPPPHLEHLWL